MISHKNGRLNVDWKTALGASRVVPVSNKKIATPIDLVAQQEEVLLHISSKQGQLTEQEQMMEHTIPVPAGTWAVLEEMVDQLEDRETRITPEQLAVLFIEDGIRRGKQSSKTSFNISSYSKECQ